MQIISDIFADSMIREGSGKIYSLPIFWVGQPVLMVENMALEESSKRGQSMTDIGRTPILICGKFMKNGCKIREKFITHPRRLLRHEVFQKKEARPPKKENCKMRREGDGAKFFWPDQPMG
jgi:hypothetical protein